MHMQPGIYIMVTLLFLLILILVYEVHLATYLPDMLTMLLCNDSDEQPVTSSLQELCRGILSQIHSILLVIIYSHGQVIGPVYDDTNQHILDHLLKHIRLVVEYLRKYNQLSGVELLSSSIHERLIRHNIFDPTQQNSPEVFHELFLHELIVQEYIPYNH